MSIIPATPSTTLQTMTGPMIMRTRLMKASPRGLVLSARAGSKCPRRTPASMAMSTWSQSCRMRRTLAFGGGLGCVRPFCQPRIHAARVILEDLFLVRRAQWQRVDIALGVVVIMPRARVDTSHRTHHLRAKQDVVYRNDLRQQLDAGQVIHARVHEHVLQQQLLERWPLQILRQAAIAAPMKRYGAATVWDDEAQGREVLEQVGGQKLHERSRISVDVVSAGGMEVRVAGGAHVHHCGHVELNHLFVQRVPVPIGERRRVPMSARRIGIQIAANESQFLHTPFELRGAVDRWDSG